MSRLELALFAWPDPLSPAPEGPRLLGRVTDADLVGEVRDRIAASHLRDLRELGEAPLRLVPGGGEADPE